VQIGQFLTRQLTRQKAKWAGEAPTRWIALERYPCREICNVFLDKALTGIDKNGERA